MSVALLAATVIRLSPSLLFPSLPAPSPPFPGSPPEPRAVAVAGPCFPAVLAEVDPPPPPTGAVHPPFYAFGFEVPGDAREGLLWLVGSSLELHGDWSAGRSVELCVEQVMVDCPAGDERGAGFRLERLDTGEWFGLHDALHQCGGA